MCRVLQLLLLLLAQLLLPLAFECLSHADMVAVTVDMCLRSGRAAGSLMRKHRNRLFRIASVTRLVTELAEQSCVTPMYVSSSRVDRRR